MARAETGSGLDRPRHQSCRMEAPQPYPWPGRIGASQQRPSAPPCAQREETAAPLPGAHPRDSSMAESTDSDREDQQSRRRGVLRRAPLCDPPTQREAPLQAPQGHGAPGEGPLEGPQADEEVRRVASQLRTIGDSINATMLRRAGAPQDWRGVWGRLRNFICDTLSVLYRLA